MTFFSSLVHLDSCSTPILIRIVLWRLSMQGEKDTNIEARMRQRSLVSMRCFNKVNANIPIGATSVSLACLIVSAFLKHPLVLKFMNAASSREMLTSEDGYSSKLMV